MTSSLYAQQSYAASANTVGTEQDAEYAIFARVTKELKTAADSENFVQLVAALDRNRKLWVLLASDVADENNSLPEKLRAQIMYLYEFVNQHTAKMLRRNEDATIDVLIDVNRSIMRGLRGVPAEQP